MSSNEIRISTTAIITVGSIVKIVRKGEAFWLIVTEINGKRMKGKVDNKLVGKHRFDIGDVIGLRSGEIVEVAVDHDKNF